jgi:exosome complex exonuclease RRP6
LDFVDKDIGNLDPIKPPSTESTPFKLVEEVKDLKELAAKLRGVNEFAVNLTTEICVMSTSGSGHTYMCF